MLVYVSEMTAVEAREALTAISEAVLDSADALERARTSLRRLRALILDFYARKGYKALGYSSFAAFARSELRGSLKLAYQLKDCAEIELSLLESGVDLDPDTPTRWLRELLPFKDDPTALRTAYYTALDLANRVGKPLSRRFFEQAVEQIAARRRLDDAADDYRPIVDLARDGVISLQSALGVIAQLDQLAPAHRRLVLEVASDSGLSDPDLVKPLADVLIKDSSLTKDEILATKSINGVPLGRATARDLEALKQENARLHMEMREQALLDQKGVISCVVTIYKNDAERTRRALIRELGAQMFSEYLRAWHSTE